MIIGSDTDEKSYLQCLLMLYINSKYFISMKPQNMVAVLPIYFGTTDVVCTKLPRAYVIIYVKHQTIFIALILINH